MIKLNLPKFWLYLTDRECRNKRGTLLQKLLCWLIGCCPEEAGKGKAA